MALWLLTPVFDHLDHPFWARSLNKEPVSVVADDEDQAKERAMAEGNNDNAVLRIPGVDAPHPGRTLCWSMRKLSSLTWGRTDRGG